MDQSPARLILCCIVIHELEPMSSGTDFESNNFGEGGG
jgi:hypothetical protein